MGKIQLKNEAAMTRNIWHYVELKVGQIITFENKRWIVLGQALRDKGGHYFPKSRYYTKLQEVSKCDK